MTNPLIKFLSSFSLLQFFIPQSRKGTRVSHGHNPNQSSEVTQPSMHPSSSPPTQTTPHQNEINQEDPVTPSQALDPVFEMVRGQELGKHVLVLVIPIVIFLITTYNPLNMSIYFTLPVILLCIGFMVIWNGILLRKVFQHASNWIEILGISLVLLAFYGIIAPFLPGYAVWIPFLCWVLTMIPFTVSFFSKKNRNGQPGGASYKSSVPLLPL